MTATEVAWCVRCGTLYEDDRSPLCECAGDPPVDKTGADWQAYVARVEGLRYVPRASS